MILSFTGHRPDKLGGYGDEVFDRLVEFAVKVLRPRQNEIDHVVVGGALGWDTAVAHAAFALDIPYLLAEPFLGQCARWPQDSKTRYAEMEARAQKVIVVCEGDYAAWKMQERNEWMVDNSDALVALWNGSDGGTANCVAYAIRNSRPWTNLWKHWNARPAVALPSVATSAFGGPKESLP